MENDKKELKLNNKKNLTKDSKGAGDLLCTAST